MNKVQKAGIKDNSFSSRISAAERLTEQPLDSRIILIQELIPLGLFYVSEFISAWRIHSYEQEEVGQLAGPRYEHSDERRDVVRQGEPAGMRVFIECENQNAITLRSGQKHQQGNLFDRLSCITEPTNGDFALLMKILLGISCNKYEDAASTIPLVLGLSPSSVSKRIIKSSAQQLKAFNHSRRAGL